ncbi:MAG: 50S ribosomal protein L9 [Bacilli bacterium]|nr:50S ribosomal protein L9 [Bacilli bacterium]
MKRKDYILTIFLFIITVGCGITAFVLNGTEASNKALWVTILFGLTVAGVTTLINILIRFKQMRKENFLENRLNMWNTISYRVKKAGETAFNELPIGILVLNNNYEVVWSNNFAKNLFMSQLERMNLSNIHEGLYKNLKKEITDFSVQIYGKSYQIRYVAENKIVYLTDITSELELEKRYVARTTALGYINIDNLEEALSDFDVQERAEYMWKIIGVIAKWADSFGAYARAYSDKNYIIIMDYAQLKQMMKKDFSILDEIKTIIKVNSAARISLSIGIACIDEGISELAEHANEQLEMAENRGGDQVVVRIDDNISYYGAKTDAVPKESKVEVRIKSEELQAVIKKYDRVLVIGHKTLDADAFGATFGIYKVAKLMDKESYMIFDPKSIDLTVERIYDSIMRDYVGLMDDFITPAQALHLLDDRTLLMIVDCQSEYLIVEPKLVKKARHIGIIDHHRQGEGSITNPEFYYSSTSASSSVELIVELLEFFEKELTFDALEATWMLLGIIVDTNNFIYRTSSKTFEVASMLKKYGADMTIVKKYLKEDITEKHTRNEFITNVEFYKDQVGIAVGRSDVIYERATLAKISDEIISINSLDVGITVGLISEDTIGISARSLGAINVQILMERLGGGGHLNNAATQIKNKTIDEVVEDIKSLVDEYLGKEESMKVILTKEVKGRGKRGDIIELQPGFANHLIRSGQAITASPENMKKHEEEKQQAAIAAEKHLQEMKELKKLVDSQTIKVYVKVGAEGKLFGSVSMKQVVDAFEKETGVALDKRKINYEDNITSLGTYDIPIQLHKEVVANIKLFVIEKE